MLQRLQVVYVRTVREYMHSLVCMSLPHISRLEWARLALLFPICRVQLFTSTRYPFLLPNLCGACYALLVLALVICYLPETRKSDKYGAEKGIRRREHGGDSSVVSSRRNVCVCVVICAVSTLRRQHCTVCLLAALTANIAISCPWPCILFCWA